LKANDSKMSTRFFTQSHELKKIANQNAGIFLSYILRYPLVALTVISLRLKCMQSKGETFSDLPKES